MVQSLKLLNLVCFWEKVEKVLMLENFMVLNSWPNCVYDNYLTQRNPYCVTMFKNGHLR